MEDVVVDIVIVVEVTQQPLHVVVPHPRLHHTKLVVHELAPECFARPPKFTVLPVIETRVADALYALGNVDAREADD